MKRLLMGFLVAFLALSVGKAMAADDADISGNGIPVVIHDDLKIKYNETGPQFYEAIVAYGEASIDFDDRESIRDAKAEAELYAKQRLAKFLHEDVVSDESLTVMQKTLAKQDASSKQVSKTTLKEHATHIRNSAKAVLKGCKPVRTIVDKEERYVGVWYGFNQKTMRIADQVKADMRKDFSKEAPGVEKGKKSGSIIQESSDAKDFM